MKEAAGDIWNWEELGYLIVVPTNVGWRKNGTNVMGRGVAKQAALRYPELQQVYGQQCQEMRSRGQTEVWFYNNLILFPVKPLNEKAPYLSWQGKAVIELVEQSTMQLVDYTNPEDLIALPLVGCGNGGLREDVVLPILHNHLDDKFMLVRYQP